MVLSKAYYPCFYWFWLRLLDLGFEDNCKWLGFCVNGEFVEGAAIWIFVTYMRLFPSISVSKCEDSIVFLFVFFKLLMSMFVS